MSRNIDSITGDPHGSPTTAERCRRYGKNTYVTRYGSFDDYIDTVSTGPVTVGFHGQEESRTNPRSFTGSDSWDHACELARDGWTDVRDDVAALADPLRDRLRARLGTPPVFVHDVSGVAVDMGAFMAGEPENMMFLMPTEERQGGKVVRIVLNVCASGSVDARDLLKRGVAVLALVEAIAMVGGSAELIVVDTRGGRGDSGAASYTIVPVKEASQHIDPDRLMFAAAHPSMLRRFGFAETERLPAEAIKALGLNKPHGYGTVAPCPQSVLDTLGTVDVYVKEWLGGDAVNRRIVADPEAWILDTLRGIGFDVD